MTASVYDENNEIVVVGGFTDSKDFGPIQGYNFEFAYLFAVDIDANFLWGNAYFNYSYPIAHILDIEMDEAGYAANTMAVLGISGFEGSYRAFVMTMDTRNGEIKQLVTLHEDIGSQFEYYGAISYWSNFQDEEYVVASFNR